MDPRGGRPMRRLILAAILATSAAGPAFAQSDALSPLAITVACAPPAVFDAIPEHPLRVLGAQDTEPRSLFGNHDLLVVGGGTAAGVQLGQQFFLRRPITFGGKALRGVKTIAWVRVVAINDTTAI